ncbi:hypothetical protein NL676_024732 [Syzygium grande]|nr:hypothetical protein NL676_024732 [Syzygium grande]
MDGSGSIGPRTPGEVRGVNGAAGGSPHQKREGPPRDLVVAGDLAREEGGALCPSPCQCRNVFATSKLSCSIAKAEKMRARNERGGDGGRSADGEDAGRRRRDANSRQIR